jgi:hypothetical protein
VKGLGGSRTSASGLRTVTSPFSVFISTMRCLLSSTSLRDIGRHLQGAGAQTSAPGDGCVHPAVTPCGTAAAGVDAALPRSSRRAAARQFLTWPTPVGCMPRLLSHLSHPPPHGRHHTRKQWRQSKQGSWAEAGTAPDDHADALGVLLRGHAHGDHRFCRVLERQHRDSGAWCAAPCVQLQKIEGYKHPEGERRVVYHVFNAEKR